MFLATCILIKPTYQHLYHLLLFLTNSLISSVRTPGFKALKFILMAKLNVSTRDDDDDNDDGKDDDELLMINCN